MSKYLFVGLALVFLLTFGIVGLASGGAYCQTVVMPTSTEVPAYFNKDSVLPDGAVYTTAPSMSDTQIRAFLEQKGSQCTSGGSKTCLKDYIGSTPERAADEYCPNPVMAAVRDDVATIIYKVSAACNISAQWIIATLQKEQSLVTSARTASTFDKALGYGCPDGGSCDSSKAGLFNQIYSAARQMQKYRLSPGGFSFKVGVTSSTLEGEQVTPGNQATASFYNYTPHVSAQQSLYKIYKDFFAPPGTSSVSADGMISGAVGGSVGYGMCQASGADSSGLVAPFAPSGNVVVDAAIAELGKPYVWGAEGPDSFDCSGLVKWAYGKAGYNLPHYSEAQAKLSAPIPLSQAQPGDILWKKGHVGIYIGNGQYIHAPKPGDVVRTAKMPGAWEYAVRPTQKG